MPLFIVPSEAVQAAGTGSGIGPDTSDFYAVEVLGIEIPEGPKFKDGSYRLRLRFDSGDEGSELISAGYDDEGSVVPGIDEAKAINRTKFLNGIMLKLGYTKEQIAGGYTDEWFVGAIGAVEWHCASDLGAQYGKIARWMDTAELEKARASGRKPLVGRAGQPRGAPQSAGPSGPRPAPAPTASAPRPMPTPAPAPAPARTAPRPPAPPTARGV